MSARNPTTDCRRSYRFLRYSRGVPVAYHYPAAGQLTGGYT